jgi:hypothetical protein
MAIESEERWTPEYENVWYVGYVVKFDEHYWIATLEGANGDPRYRVYVHRTVVAHSFGSAVIGTRVRLRLRPNRKADGGTLWEALEAVVEPKDFAAQSADGGIENGNTTGA